MTIRVGVAVLLGAGLAGALAAGVAWAASCAPPPPAGAEGFLGRRAGTQPGDDVWVLPRNPAIRVPSSDWTAHVYSDGVRYEVSPLRVGTEEVDLAVLDERLQLARPLEPLPAGVRVSYSPTEQQAITANLVDETPPATPVLWGGGYEHTGEDGACGGHDPCGCDDWVRLDVESGDDQTPPAELSYLVYVAGSEEAARRSVWPRETMFVTREDGSIRECLSAFVSGDSQAWYAVEAVDLAGNRSARSEPIRLGDSGCAVGGGPSGITGLLVALGALRVLGRRRRRTC